MAQPVPRSSTTGDGSSAGRARAAGIYGTVVTAAVLATGGGQLRVVQLAVLVFVTLVVYWGAELYAEVLGKHVHAGRLPQGAELRALVGASWHMVTASYLPLLVLVVAALLGMSAMTASYAALITTVLLLLVHGRAAGKGAGLSGMRLVGVTALAGLFGVTMVLLKVLIAH
jgi:hypothetical protein